MLSLKRFSTQHPIQFGLVITLLVLVCYILAGVLAAVLGKNSVSRALIEAFGRLSGALFFILIVWRFAWGEA